MRKTYLYFITMLFAVTAMAADIWVDVPNQSLTVPRTLDYTTPPRVDQLLNHGFRWWDQADPAISDTNLYERLSGRVWVQDGENWQRCVATFNDTLISVRTNAEYIASTNATAQEVIRRNTPANVCDFPPLFLDPTNGIQTLLSVITNAYDWTHMDVQLFTDYPTHMTAYTNHLATRDAKYIVMTNAVRLATTTALLKTALEKDSDLHVAERALFQDDKELISDLRGAIRTLVNQLKKWETE